MQSTENHAESIDELIDHVLSGGLQNDRLTTDLCRVVAAERDRARRDLTNAPHADDCTCLEEDVVEPYGTRISPNSHCNCWKAEL